MKTLVLVPTYNERENIPILVQDILKVPGTVVLVLDDQSPDGTGAVADALARDYPGRVNVLHRTGQRGLGVSYLEGFQHAIKSDADYVVQMDADLSHDPKYLPDLISEMPVASGNGLPSVTDPGSGNPAPDPNSNPKPNPTSAGAPSAPALAPVVSVVNVGATPLATSALSSSLFPALILVAGILGFASRLTGRRAAIAT